jgi:hypothetical protein
MSHSAICSLILPSRYSRRVVRSTLGGVRIGTGTAPIVGDRNLAASRDVAIHSYQAEFGAHRNDHWTGPREGVATRSERQMPAWFMTCDVIHPERRDALLEP